MPEKNTFNKILVVAEYFYEVENVSGGQPKVFYVLFPLSIGEFLSLHSRGRWFTSCCFHPEMGQIGPEVRMSLKQTKH